MTQPDAIQIRTRIHGRVQGVWYRAWTEQTARELGLCGWVRNRFDGTVEAVFAGGQDSVDRMVGKLADGPPLARVDRIDREEDNSPCPDGFEVHPDA